MYRVIVNVPIHYAAFQGSGIKPGIILGWHKRLYELVDTVQKDKVGHAIGQVLYHGPLGMGFALYTLAGHSTAYGIVFKTSRGKFSAGLNAKPLGGPPLKSP